MQHNALSPNMQTAPVGTTPARPRPESKNRSKNRAALSPELRTGDVGTAPKPPSNRENNARKTRGSCSEPHPRLY